MWQCVTVSATSEGGQQFFGSLFGQQWVQTVSKEAIANIFTNIFTKMFAFFFQQTFYQRGLLFWL